MKRVLGFAVVVACGSPQATTTPPQPSATASATAAASAKPAPVEVTTHDKIVSFAGARGGLHGEPVRMPYRHFKLRGAECWLFFVGGAAAHAAWLATPWDPAWGKASARLPNVMASVQAPMLEDGVVFERVDNWPVAVRVTKTAPDPTGVLVTIETLAVRDQTAGAMAEFLVHDAIGSGSLPVASPKDAAAAIRLPAKNAAKDALALVRRAAASKTALAQSLVDGGAEVVQTFQKAFDSVLAKVTRDDVAASPFFARIEASLKAATECDERGSCSGKDGAFPVQVIAVGSTYRIARINIAAEPFAVAQPAPVQASPNEGLIALRMHESPTGAVRTLASVAIGTGFLLVVADERTNYIVERDGPFSRVTQVWMRTVEKSSADARIDDVDNDGTADVVLFSHWPKLKPDDLYEIHSEATATLRSRSLATEPKRDRMGAEIAMLGARDLDDAIKRVHALGPNLASPTKSEACSVLGKSSTPAGLVANSAVNARIVSFDEPESPSNVVRIVPAARATADDAAMLKDVCTDNTDGGFICSGTLCGNLGYGLGSYYRFVREGRVLKLETAFVYVGS